MIDAIADWLIDLAVWWDGSHFYYPKRPRWEYKVYRTKCGLELWFGPDQVWDGWYYRRYI